MARGMVVVLVCTWACTVGGTYGAPAPLLGVTSGPQQAAQMGGRLLRPPAALRPQALYHP
ncbi:hypothetical protein Hamer_G017479 [Homarus americanus]|uniref:Uncharacterized protein n=1 Tax=Homarus americanus TaxID=6706 RepID=A0A8J5MQX1_HOMAM|nr:hypothetical protein Hamer_G017479 [Homarus americanus]